MCEKSHVSIERAICLVCRTEYETGVVLLDKRMRPSMSRHTTTGWGLCQDHRKLFDDGFIALIECDPEKSGNPSLGGRVKPGEEYRTGTIAHVRRDTLTRLVDVPIAADQPCLFVEPGVIEKIQGLVRPPTAHSNA